MSGKNFLHGSSGGTFSVLSWLYTIVVITVLTIVPTKKTIHWEHKILFFFFTRAYKSFYVLLTTLLDESLI